MPPSRWMNDPNGPIAVNGEIHLFYQYNPYGDEWGTIHWGHAKSKDLVHWEHLPVALYPSRELGEDHCFSGCTVMYEGRPAILYTSIGPGERNAKTGAQQWLALGNDDLTQWQKSPANPILTPDIHGTLDIHEWRDPYAWQMDGVWYMVCGGTHQGSGCAVLYRSPDLLKWDFLGITAQGPERVWECPNLFQLGGKWVLTYSPDDEDNRVRYKVGYLTEEYRFVEEFSGILDYGGREGFYAATTFKDEQGRRILLGWMPDSARGTSKAISGWSGVHNVPRVLTLDEENKRLQIKPVPELQSLRDRFWRKDAFILGGELAIGISGKALELSVAVEPIREDEVFGVRLLRSPDGEEETVLEIDFSHGTVTLDRSKSSLDKATHLHSLTADLPAGKKPLELRVFVDHSTLEVFVHDEVCLSARMYPTRADSEQVQVFSKQGSIRVASLEAWTLKSCRTDG
jgi:beta-fructofuranosidase